MTALLLASLVVALSWSQGLGSSTPPPETGTPPSNISSPSAAFTPGRPVVEVEGSQTGGLVHQIDMRCGWRKLPNVNVRRVEVIGPLPDNRTGVIGVIARDGNSINDLVPPGVSVDGNVDCGYLGRSGCESDETTYAELSWPNYEVSWDDPAFEKFGCNVVGDFNGSNFNTSHVVLTRVRADEQPRRPGRPGPPSRPSRPGPPSRPSRPGPHSSPGAPSRPGPPSSPGAPSRPGPDSSPGAPSRPGGRGRVGSATTFNLPKPTVDTEVWYLTQGLANYVSVRCGWTEPTNVTASHVQVLGQAPQGGYVTIIGYVTANQTVISMNNTARMTLDGSLSCGPGERGCRKGETVYASMKWPGYPTTWNSSAWMRFGCQVMGTQGTRPFLTRKIVSLRVREDKQNDIIDPRISDDPMHFRLRGGLKSDGRVNYLFMRCSAIEGMEGGMSEVHSIEVYKPSGSILSGVYVQGNHTNSEGNRGKVNFQMNCDSNNEGCARGEKAFLAVIWRKMDWDRDIGSEGNGDFYSLKCKVSGLSAGGTATYEQTRTVRVQGGMMTND